MNRPNPSSASPDHSGGNQTPTNLARQVGLTVVSACALMAAQFFRNTSVTNRVWAEDGAVFGRQAFENHIWQQVGRGYAGYLVAPERILAAPIVSVVPVSQWGRWFALSAMAVATFAALAVFRLSGGILRSWPTRAALAVLVAVGPKMRGEWPAIANVGWPLLVAMFWVIVSVRSDRFSTALRCVIAALAITASGLGLAFIPLAVLVLAAPTHPLLTRFLDRPSLVATDDERAALKRADRLVGVVILVAAVLQVIGLATAVAGPKAFRSTPLDIGRLLMVRIFGSSLVGERFVDDAWKQWGMAFAVLAVLVVLVGLGVGLRGASNSARSLAFVAVAYAVAIGAASLKTRGTEPFALQSGKFTFDADRYFIIPTFLVLSAVAIAIDRATDRATDRRRSAVADVTDSEGIRTTRLATGLPVPSLVFAAFVAIVLVATGFSLRNPEQPSDPWSVALAKARTTCRTDAGLSRVDIPIAPAGIFRLSVPCSRLR